MHGPGKAVWTTFEMGSTMYIAIEDLHRKGRRHMDDEEKYRPEREVADFKILRGGLSEDDILGWVAALLDGRYSFPELNMILRGNPAYVRLDLEKRVGMLLRGIEDALVEKEEYPISIEKAEFLELLRKEIMHAVLFPPPRKQENETSPCTHDKLAEWFGGYY